MMTKQKSCFAQDNKWKSLRKMTNFEIKIGNEKIKQSPRNLGFYIEFQFKSQTPIAKVCGTTY